MEKKKKNNRVEVVFSWNILEEWFVIKCSILSKDMNIFIYIKLICIIFKWAKFERKIGPGFDKE